MSFVSQDRVLSWAIILLLLASSTSYSSASVGKTENNIKSAVFLSPKIELGPGLVTNKNYFDVDFPRGHIALKSFNAEIIDEAGNPVPLQETYLHHWVVVKYHQPKNATNSSQTDNIVMDRNSGLCQLEVLGQYFGVGSETRRTATYIPDPFGIEIGNPAEIPDGYNEKWMINVHAIDTRGVEDRMGCIECRCDLYNVTKDADGKPLSPDYGGGLQCCPDNLQCKMKKGFQGPKRILYLRYTVKWVNWDNFVVPVKIYIFDVTDTLKVSNKSKGISPEHDCQVEYQVEPCSKGHKDGSSCLNVKRTSLPMPTGGYVIYGVAHQHVGATGSTVYGQDGRVICSSTAVYGNGNAAGNEKGYVVGMSTCYPRPGSIKINDGETLTLEVNYTSIRRHTGVMGLFYLLVAEKLPHQHF